MANISQAGLDPREAPGRPWGAQGSRRRPQEAPWSPRGRLEAQSVRFPTFSYVLDAPGRPGRPREAPGCLGKPQDALGGPREAQGGPGDAWKRKTYVFLRVGDSQE